MIQMIQRKTWEEFRIAGLLWWANRLLHTFGWAIVVEVADDGSITDAYPARVKFRGFAEKDEVEGFIAVSRYVQQNAEELTREAEE